MKKSLLILSMAAMAVNAVAFDQPVAGTADAPNYYVIKANRGVPYLAYSAEGVDAPNGKTNLTRTNDLTTANVWAVTAGTAEGSLVIKNYTADAYLMDFFNASGSTVAAGANANTVSTPTDIFAIDMGGAYALNINSADGAAYPDNCLSLDAPGGTALYCGNYMPTAASGTEGACWWFAKVTVADGQTMEQAVAALEQNLANAELEKQLQAVKNAYLPALQQFQEAVPVVSADMQTAIDQINALTIADDFNAKAGEIWGAAITAGNNTLKTAFTGKTVAMRNVRRMVTAPEGAYIAVNADGTGFIASTTFANPNAAFVFSASSTEGAYVAFNQASGKWFGKEGTAYLPVAAETQAAPLTITLANREIQDQGFKYGVNISTGDGVGFNWQSWDGGAFGEYGNNDDGNLWQIVDADSDAMLADAIASVVNTLSPYIPNVKPVSGILEQAISDAKALTFTADVADKANAITAKAIEDANTFLAAGLANKTYTLKYLRGDNFLSIANGAYGHSDAKSGNEVEFTFKANADGGYVIYNTAANLYVGPQTTEEGKNSLTLVADQAQAQVVYPVLQTAGTFAGVAFPFSAEKTGVGINMNASNDAFSYSITDGGSIFGLMDPDSSSLIDAVDTAAPVREGIYDLSGRRLSAPVRGINIINGKKVLVK